MFKYALVALLAVGLTSSHHLGNFQLGAPLKPDGTVDETPEVKLASAAHHAAHAMVRGHIVPGISTYASAPLISAAPLLRTAPLIQATPLVYSSPLVAYSVNKYVGPAAPLNADGTVAETPEVQHAKATHFALYNEAAAKSAPASAHVAEYGHFGVPVVADYRYAGPAAPLNPDGTVAETPEVMHAKAIHFAAKEEAKARNYHASISAPLVASHIEAAPVVRYAGPAAPLNADGTVAETPEVMHAKAVHFALYNDAAAKAAASPDYSDYTPQYYGHGAPLNADGTVADTPEVMHAKAVHYAAKEEAKARNYHAAISTPVVAVQPVQTIAHVQPVQTISHVQPILMAQNYVEPAPLNADGTVADTVEVQHAKAVHFSLYNQAASRSAAHVYSPSYYTTPVVYRHKRSLYHAAAPLNADGTVAETPEVMHAKAIHFAAKEEAKARNYHAALAAPVIAVQPLAHIQPIHTIAHVEPVFAARQFVEPAPLNADGTVAETPAVQQAKAVHFALYNEAAAKSASAHVAHISHVAAPVVADYRYAGPAAPLNPDGTVAETPEVVHAKVAHFAAKEEAKARNYHAAISAPIVAAHIEAAPVLRYAGPAAPLNADGTVAETPEVQHAKATHYALYNEAAAKSAPAILSYSAPLVSTPVLSSVSTPLVYAPAHYATTHYNPAPLNADGTVAETAEVQQAKALHFALYNEAQAKTALHYY